MTDIYLHCLCAHYGLYGNAPVSGKFRLAAIPSSSSATSSYALAAAISVSKLPTTFRTPPRWTTTACHLAVRLRNARIKNVCKYEPCMVHNLQIIFKRTRTYATRPHCTATSLLRTVLSVAAPQSHHQLDPDRPTHKPHLHGGQQPSCRVAPTRTAHLSPTLPQPTAECDE